MGEEPIPTLRRAPVNLAPERTDCEQGGVLDAMAVEISELRNEVRRLSDVEAIRERLDRYSTLLDSGRWNRIPEEIFTEDAVDYHAPDEGAWASPRGHAEIKEFFEKVMPMFAGTQHLLGNSRIVVNGDRASSRVYALCSHWVDESSESDLTAAIIYDDLWRRESGGWRICERRVYSCGPHGKVVGVLRGARLTPDSELYGRRDRGRPEV